jgi:hypothetical protein
LILRAERQGAPLARELDQIPEQNKAENDEREEIQGR